MPAIASESEAQPRLVTVGRSAELLSCSTRTIDRLLDAGHLVRVRIGRSVRVTAASIDQLIAEGGVKAVEGGKGGGRDD